VQGPLGVSSTTCADAFAYVPTNGLPLPAHGCAVAFPLHTAGPGGGAPQKVSLSVPTGGSATLLDAGANAVTTLTTAAGRFQLNGGVITYTPAKAYQGAGAVSYRLQGDGGGTATSTYSTTITVPPPPIAPALTSIGDPGVTQQKAIGIVAGDRLELLDAANRPASMIVVSGEGRYELSGGAILLFEPDHAFRGRARGIHYRLTDEYHQSATGTYVPTVTGGTIGTGGGTGGSTPAVRLTTATLNVATSSGVVPIGCGLSTGLIADCRVALVATVGVKHVTLGVGVNSPDQALASLVVRVALTAQGRALIRRPGGIAVRAQASVSVAGLPGHVTGAVALRAVAPSFLLAHSVRFTARSARLSASEKRFLASLARSLAGVRRIDCIGAARDVRKGSRRTSLAKARAKAVCGFLRTRLPRATVLAPRAEHTGDRRGTTRHADLILRY
jgi:CshA-type fibril repeat protein